ncbi:MAG: hypothetical protein RM347_024970 [Nostoc sp. ChiQUE02]|uniref:hypothetical protein n=1 Tax=Nostoc sp. ChiQUE02 TaxID=3075377 RepID=UPI002AD1D746|nr:hypothetical protein [Nostoc sp. ChiQUE02]MDZ8229273.1 hypothetical protein [Nostoc sp. ChiQUE02]
MLDYLTAGIAFWTTLFGVQESLLEFRLGYLGRYWFLAISASLLLSFLLSAPIITLIIKFAVDPFTFLGNVILCAIAAVIFGVILSLAQWLILRQTQITPRVFALINTVIGILVYFLLVWLNEGSLEWSGNFIQGWKTVIISWLRVISYTKYDNLNHTIVSFDNYSITIHPYICNCESSWFYHLAYRRAAAAYRTSKI